MSTDEVYGPLPTSAAAEDAPLHPTVPYAASKACSDLLAHLYFTRAGSLAMSANFDGTCSRKATAPSKIDVDECWQHPGPSKRPIVADARC
ncbi:GDP-mannose 4,6-dehydratase [Amycolatopsis sp. cg9]|uniref:GDP-mannose 4,6-dehydratase n=1 Tax=Amycolatopsis sp. cg9 TaxID=3238801 RepID=UPI003524FE08